MDDDAPTAPNSPHSRRAFPRRRAWAAGTDVGLPLDKHVGFALPPDRTGERERFGRTFARCSALARPSRVRHRGLGREGGPEVRELGAHTLTYGSALMRAAARQKQAWQQPRARGRHQPG